jgi:type IV pilus modification protein PilV
MNAKPSRRHQAGSSLIEVLIALGLVAVTMLGLLALQLRTLGLQKDSLDRRAAAVLVGGFADRVSVNFTAFRAGGYDTTGADLGPTDTPPASTTACGTATNCTPAEVAARDWALFQIDVRNRLPQGVAFLRSDATGTQITVGWFDPARTDAQTGSAAAGAAGRDAACTAVGLSDDNYRCYSARVSP